MSIKLVICTSALLLALNLYAATESERHALVIGNASYQSGSLPNPLNDARDMAAALTDSGFQVHSLLDADASAMEQAILDFGDKLRAGGVGLFYYAGHGVQARDSNYLIPLQANISREIQLKRKSIDLGWCSTRWNTPITGSISSSSTLPALTLTLIASIMPLVASRPLKAARVFS